MQFKNLQEFLKYLLKLFPNDFHQYLWEISGMKYEEENIEISQKWQLFQEAINHFNIKIEYELL